MNRLVVHLSAFILLLASAALADRITLSNGRVIEGRVLSRDERSVQVESGGMVTRLNMESIRSISQSLPWENTVIAAESALRRRQGTEGIDLLLQARREGAPMERLRQSLDELNPGLTSAARGGSDKDRSDLRRSIKSLVDSDLLTSRTLFFASQNLFLLDDWQGALTVLDRIEPADIAGDAAMQSWSLDFMRTVVRRSLNAKDYKSAVAAVEKMRLLGGDATTPQLPIALLARSAEARDVGDFKGALEIIAMELQPLVPEIARNRAAFTVARLQEWAGRTHRYAEAREALAPMAHVFPVDHAAARNALIAAEARYHSDRSAPLLAIAAIETVAEAERSVEMRKLHSLARHEATMAEIDQSQPLELIKHGKWCAENGLLDEAINLFERARVNATVRDLCDELTANARRERDTSLLTEAKDHFASGDMAGVQRLTSIILKNPDRGSALRKEAEQLADLAGRSFAREKEARGPRAVVVFQQAERAFFLQNFSGSLEYLHMVMTQFPDTPAAKWSADLLPDVVRALEIAYIEGRTKTLPDFSHQFTIEQTQGGNRLGVEVAGLLDAVGGKP